MNTTIYFLPWHIFLSLKLHLSFVFLRSHNNQNVIISINTKFFVSFVYIWFSTFQWCISPYRNSLVKNVNRGKSFRFNHSISVKLDFNKMKIHSFWKIFFTLVTKSACLTFTDFVVEWHWSLQWYFNTERKIHIYRKMMHYSHLLSKFDRKDSNNAPGLYRGSHSSAWSQNAKKWIFLYNNGWWFPFLSQGFFAFH